MLRGGIPSPGGSGCLRPFLSTATPEGGARGLALGDLSLHFHKQNDTANLDIKMHEDEREALILGLGFLLF